jgi:hypothetical protein
VSSRQKLYLAAFLLHFFFVIAVSSHELFWILANGLTVAPSSLKPFWKGAEDCCAATLGQRLPRAADPLRKGIATYLNLAGIEAGYGFFAPNVSNSCKLVFELRYPDGRVGYEVPAVGSEASGLRVATLLDKMGRPQYAPLQPLIIRMLTDSMWRQHSDATGIRSVFGAVILPSIPEYERGMRESNHFLSAYDFDFREPGSNHPN